MLSSSRRSSLRAQYSSPSAGEPNAAPISAQVPVYTRVIT
jgi:hypothetical protein